MKRMSSLFTLCAFAMAFLGCDGARCREDRDCGAGNACAQDPPNSECHSGPRAWSNCPTVCRKRCDDGGPCPTSESCTNRLAVWDIGDNYDKVTAFDAGVCSPAR